jgi:hypothetical protein
MTAKCSLNGQYLNSEFTLVGEVPSAELDEVEPLVEVWEPIGNNEIAGQFRIAWKKSGKIVISADAKSQYHPGNSTELMPILHRYISIKAELESCRFSLRQKSMIFHQLSGVND